MHIEPFSLKWAIRNMVFGYHNITWFLQNLMADIIIAPLLYPIIKRKKLSIIILGLLYLYVVITNSSWIGYGGLYLIVRKSFFDSIWKNRVWSNT